MLTPDRIQNRRRTNNMESDLDNRMTKIEAEMDAIKNRVSGMEQRAKRRKDVRSTVGAVKGNGTKE